MKTNSIYEALGNVDDKLVNEAAVTRKKRPIALIIVAAAAAAAMLTIVGFSEKVGDGRNSLVIGDNEAVLSLDLRAKDIKIPEKYYSEVEWSSEPQPYFYGRQMDMSPSELTAEFGVEPLGIHNENFSEEIIDFEPNHVWNGKGELLWTYNGEPQLSVYDHSIEFRYYLQSKSLGRHISIEAKYVIDDRYSSGGSIGIGEDTLYKIIRLNDRSECFITNSSATFSYDGVYYSVGLGDYTRGYDNEQSLDETMQILKDLGVL